jgi:hypothetical protein
MKSFSTLGDIPTFFHEDMWGVPESYARASLDHEAKKSDWKTRKEITRQMSLF